MPFVYKIASLLVLVILGATWMASYYGWGVPSEAAARARSVRQGSIHGRTFVGGGPGFGK
jgi:hypothetical protein